MWLLVSERGELFLVTPKQEHVVSRKGGAITLSDDQSISRQHAKILLENDDQNDNSGIVLVDTSSKYGTFVNSGIESNTRIETNQRITLKHDDLVRFGLQWNMWRVVFMPVIILTSTLNHQEKAEIKSHIEKIGGRVVSNWSPVCTHLTMNQITLTVKVVSALGAGQHIVTPQYWQNLIKTIELKKGKLPDPVAFIPPLNEETLNQNNVSFLFNKQRSSLFKSLLFVAVSLKQKRRIEPMVTSAGGSVVEFSECNLSQDDMCREGVIVMQSLPSPGSGSQVPESYLGVVKYLTSKGLRCIPESDIGLSIVYCSREKFCNPKHTLQSLFQHHTTPKEQTQSSTVLAQNTQENSLGVAGTSVVGKIINETCTGGIFTASSTKSNKRPRDENNKSNSEESLQFKKPNNISSYFKIRDTSESSNTFSNNDNEISKNNSEDYHSVKKDDKIKSLKKDDVHVDNESDDDKFSFVNEKEQTSAPSNSEDIFSSSRKNSTKTVTNYNANSFDIFGTNIKSSALPKQNDTGSKSSVFSSSAASVKQNYSIFQVSAKKHCVSDDDDDDNNDNDNDDFKFKKNNDDDDDDDDFKFHNSKNSSNTSLNDNIFGTSNCNKLKRKTTIDDPFQNNKSDCSKRLKSDDDDDRSYSRGMKRNMSVEELPAKKPAINIIDIVSDDDDDDDDDDDNIKNKNTILEHVTNAGNLESFVIKKEIKQEAFEEGYIRDEKLHDSTVVTVKSLIVPLRDISVSSSRSDIMKKSSSVNFKKFRKATPLKTPDFIDLIPYKENTDCWTEKAAAICVSDSSSEEDVWEFQQSHTARKKKIRI